jgi:Asp-tRNA(Asn)/Glu-tRNA(Gln) amidotransferase A subunit family amidase
MSDSDLCYISATDAIARFKAKTLSPVELVDAVIDRAEAVEDKINALTFTYFDEARDKAKKAEAKYASGDATGDLEGLPIGIKDEGSIKGLPTTNGSFTMKDYVPDFTSPVNQRVLDAGGIVHARTATPEFSCTGVTWTDMWGVTRNPWNTDYTPGGSSGGSSASLASGTSTICTGSDIGGSIRIPASTTGLVGYKPPYGRNPDDAPLNLDFFCHTGPLARTVQDAILLQNVMAGPHELDVVSLRPKLTLPTKYEPIKDWKIAYSLSFAGLPVDNEVIANTEAALDVFRSLGATVEEVDLGWTPEMIESQLTYLAHIFGAFIGGVYAEHKDIMTKYARQFAEMSAVSSNADYLETLQMTNRMYATLGPILGKYNAFICPTTALPSVSATHDSFDDKIIINGEESESVLGWVMTTPFNALSRCPVLQVPSGQASNGVPTGIQIVGPTYSDEVVFQAATAYEEALGGWFTETDARPVI